MNVITPPCPRCHETHTVQMTGEQYNALNDPNDRRQVAQILSDKTPEEWELCISGMDGECWDATFAGYIDDEEDESMIEKETGSS